jgi:hypothetical protein
MTKDLFQILEANFKNSNSKIHNIKLKQNEEHNTNSLLKTYAQNVLSKIPNLELLEINNPKDIQQSYSEYFFDGKKYRIDFKFNSLNGLYKKLESYFSENENKKAIALVNMSNNSYKRLLQNNNEYKPYLESNKLHIINLHLTDSKSLEKIIQ